MTPCALLREGQHSMAASNLWKNYHWCTLQQIELWTLGRKRRYKWEVSGIRRLKIQSPGIFTENSPMLKSGQKQTPCQCQVSLFLFFPFFFFFVVQGLQLRAFTLNTPSAPFLGRVFQDRVSWTPCPGCLQTMVLLISASWVARITDVSHRRLASQATFMWTT
jgi:hypothetical protein